jgi:hypothetical protein
MMFSYWNINVQKKESELYGICAKLLLVVF